MIDFAVARERMIHAQVVSRGLADPALIKAVREVPREAFVEPGLEEVAYEDTPLRIGQGQTISQPYIVALMIDSADIGAGNAFLEIGTGSGYAAAVLSRMAGYVHTVERHSALAEQARRRFERFGYRNISVKVGDGTAGWPQAAPYDAILVAAAAPAVPQSLKEQLNLGGRLIIPVGLEGAQRLKRITRTGISTFEEDDLGGVLFVPLIGEQGWAETGCMTRVSQRAFRASSPMRQNHCLPSMILPSAGSLTGSAAARSCFLANPATEHPNSTRPGRRSPEGWWSGMASTSSRWKPIGRMPQP
jgi:protein-L-isoaspartate(D-aspartate) O-methyltransferase